MDTGKLIDSMKRVVKSELGSYDTTATVKRVEGDTAWVHIPGGVDETPVRLTMNAKEGDNVQVRVSDGKAFLAGNVSAPPTDDTTAEAAKALANRAAEDAGRAKSAADIAESYATSAQASAAQSASILEGMEQAAIAAGTTLDGIYADAAEAKATTDEINDYADSVSKTVSQVLEDGETAGSAAAAASEAASTALVSLSTVEDVVGVLNWITAHGTMTLTSDITVNPSHVYFIVDPTGDYVVGGTHYSIVSEPNDADIGTYYELTVDESVQNYVATHVAVDSEGLWLIPDNGIWRVLIATGGGGHTYSDAGMYIIWRDGGVDKIHAKFTSDGNIMKGGMTLGNQTSAGLNGVAAGTYTTADNLSYAFGFGLNANGPNSLVIGRNNIPDTETPDAWGYRKYPFIIGNGDKSTYLGTKSNALTVDWSGNVEAAGNVNIASGAAYKINGTALAASDVGAVPTTRTVNSKALSSDITLSASDVGALAEDANGDISITRNITAGGDIEATGGGVFGDDVSVTGYNMSLENDNGDVFVSAKRSDTGAQADIGVGQGGVNHGLYSRSNDKWIIYDNDTGITRIPATDIRLAGHSSGIGTVKDAYNSSAVSLPNSTGKAVTSVSLEAGVWLITFGGRFSTNANGERRICISQTSGASDLNINSPAVSGQNTQLKSATIVTLAATTTYYLNLYQTSGTQLSAPASGANYGNFIKAVRLL